MTKTKKIIFLLIAVVVLAVAYYALSPLFITLELNESSPEYTTEIIVDRAEVVDNPAHPASGFVSVLDTEAGRVLRYEDFETINGPDLFIYLSTDLGATEFVNLGDIRATVGNANYQIPDDVDLDKYKYALVWCKRFGVLFNYADISVAN